MLMSTTKTNIVLLVVVLALIGVSVATRWYQATEYERAVADRDYIEAFEEETVHQISITSADATLEFEKYRPTSGWKQVEGESTIDISRDYVVLMLRMLDSATVQSVVSTNEDTDQQYGLDPAQQTEVVLRTEEGEEIAAITVGHEAGNDRVIYARKDGEKNVVILNAPREVFVRESWVKPEEDEEEEDQEESSEEETAEQETE